MTPDVHNASTASRADVVLVENQSAASDRRRTSAHTRPASASRILRPHIAIRATLESLDDFLGQQYQQDLWFSLVRLDERWRHDGELEVQVANHQQVVAVVDDR